MPQPSRSLLPLRVIRATPCAYDLGYQHTDTEDAEYEAVTLVQTQAAAIKFLKPESLVVAVVKPAN